MKRLMTALFIFVGVIPVLAGQHPSGPHSHVIDRGVPIAAEAKVVTIAQIRENPDAYAKDPVVVEGVVTKACWIRGCWMNLSSESGDAKIHVTFKGDLTVPRGSKGWKARIVGVTRSKTEEGKTRVWFVASGVELTN